MPHLPGGLVAEACPRFIAQLLVSALELPLVRAHLPALEHPITRRAFAGFTVPSYAEACSLAVSLHRRLPGFGMVSWDVAIDAEGSPVLIESNLRYQEINFLQLNNGPLFGRYTDEVLSMM